MKRFLSLPNALSALFCLVFTIQVHGQRQILPSNLVGVDLKKVQQDYLKGMEKGNDSLIVPYAEALYYDGHITQSFTMYQRADSMGIVLSNEHQRNYEHAAKKLNRESPYSKQTGYFSAGWQPKASIRKTCLNTPEEDFAPYVWKEIIFVTSSRRVEDQRQQDAYRFTQLPFLDVNAFNSNCQTVSTAFLPADLNTEFHDGPIAISADTALVIITRNYTKPNEKNQQNLFLDVYTRRYGEWNKEMPFPYNDPSYSNQHPFFDDKTRTLYFSSDKPGGFGGFDLYKSSWDGFSWSEPENLGPGINSPYDEVFPSFSPEGHLIYGSNHIETAGGLDLVIFIDGQRHLLPDPFNTVSDDLTITFIDQNSGYFASNRNQSMFNDDIYSFSFLPTPFIVRVIDKGTGEPVPGVRVSYNSVSPALSGNLVTDNNGEGKFHEGLESVFPVDFRLNKEVYKSLDITTNDFAFVDNRWLTIIEIEKEERVLTIADVIPKGYFIVYFDNDHPDPDSWSPETDLRYDETYWTFRQQWPEYYERSASSRAELDEFFMEVEQGIYQLEYLAGYLIDEFKQGRQYVIEFTSHASPLAASEYNMILSKRRFVSVENYLKAWDEGTMMRFINQHMLDYDNNPFGATLAPSSVSSDPRDPANSIYSVEAARERRVTVTWRGDSN